MKKLLLIITMFAFLNVANSQTLLHYFKFNNSTSNVAGTASFSGGNIGSYGIGMDVTNIGKRVVSGDNLICNLSNLPQGNAPRSFSIWSRFPANAATQYIFSYGTDAANQAFGISHGNNINLYGWSNDLILSNASALNTWYHYVCTYDGSTMKLYLNGTLLGSKVAALNTTGTNAYIGTAANSSLNSVNALVDELQIYSGALTQAQVTYLFTVGGPVISTPTITAISPAANGSSSATINYSLNANGGTTTSIVKYGTTPSSLTNQVTGFSANGSTTLPGTATLTGLVAGTVYYYKIEATNSMGTTSSTVENFINAQTPANGLVGYFGFENNFTSNNSVHSFTQSGWPFPEFNTGKYGTGVSFGASGYGTLDNDSMDAVFPTSSEFTVCFWQKAATPTVNFASSFEMFGSFYFRSYLPNGFNYFGLAYNSTSFTEKDANQYASFVNTWTHYTITMRIDPATNYRWFRAYVNGNLAGEYNMGFQYGFYKFIPRIILGGGTIGGNGQYSLNNAKKFTGVLDELYFYDRALTNNEILAVMSNGTGMLANADFITNKLQATIYPNPTSDNFSIEMENEVQSVEIYSIQGQKVLTSNSKDINVSNLSKGMYMVRIEDSNNAVSTQKLIIK
ncbi:LamG-like jellyroll fold domain-containing protein [Flavobacterium sp.]|uniref:LamG-like jellyroll fold domain-containing protein n=1 Tax=Flavobacterium sp. TaxID=239 RepID=UPI0025C37E6B|nr:LamG-like jellyroll fold domain-containing protein [Flavobacterium sp.]